ncbi:16S rRNA (uracil(1498)-N(3))-methyltransferase [Carnobacterium maltaromaticum]|uniref:16S rRNA (uracil(1498)-N(3))-methyltransferase n=1 Tax=Carnobacterium maltaromaticum TaxID=2751 RepID=UPI000C774A0A|nr:16S rRNA (uracil(1498)-N(3))-methyltransferase [Carnobacterium maltaromaticum]PLS34570.1 16S rRNA (uracil(1498)-N(3))-methyltransferase [Carnobacterium maltaromaticum]PLS36389.1 16S rRNA (uracil(1498)-N(3))-methyltransferase [Carnobacterium maltaromaticum]PLS37203.1 16S rRNA (uracil(1498)-N(3))-methyltransferase [Carnobacterium maltaromaticum]PLS43419.1 16S rRNA (uracil(1498)-N(3))-methyltransferase [Carnobacterium maltaromaticum]PLS43764.1 16S rRNA (uracil(1498)-N(3))-methyltransferase [Ca
MQRYFLKEMIDDYQNQLISIEGDQYHHMIRVMRMKVEDKVFLVLPNSQAFIAEIQTIENDYLNLKWIADEHQNKELPVEVTIVSGLPKGDKLELIVQKGTELGASHFIPFAAKFSITKWDEKKGLKKIQRLEKIALEAAEQAQRHVVPTIEAVHSLSQLIEMSQRYDRLLVAYEESAKVGEDQNFAKVLKNLETGEKVLVVFGPEGGLSEKEISSLTDAGFICCALGPRILRTETAPLYVLSALSYQLELNQSK